MKSENKFSGLSDFNKKIVSKFVDMSLDISKYMLLKENGFHPFAICCNSLKDIKIIGINDNLSLNTKGAMDSLKSELKQLFIDGKYSAIMIAYDISFKNALDDKFRNAICLDIKIDHVFANRFIYPYSIQNNLVKIETPEADMLQDIF